MLDQAREQAVWERVCASGGQKPDLSAIHIRRQPPTRRSCLTPTLQVLTLLRLLLR